MTTQGNLAIRYRPTTFGAVVGQPLVVAALRHIAKAEGITTRAIFIKGPHGSGKTTLSRIMAKAMNCETFQQTGEVCNECSGCLEAESKNSRLYYEFDSSQVGKVDKIEELRSIFNTQPPGRRVITFDEVHACSKQSLNALLKIVEDGVKNTMFIFASTEDLLPTLRSRCLRLDINLIPHQDIIDHLAKVAQQEHITIDQDTLNIIAIKSQGHMRDALSGLQLYQVAGKEALTTSYELVRSFLIGCFMRPQDPTSPYHPTKQAIESIMRYPMYDVVNSIQAYLRIMYTAQEGEDRKMYMGGHANTLFNYFYSTTATNALKDETGLYILLTNLYEKTTPKPR